MKKIIGFLLVCLFAVSCSSLSGKKGILDKTLEGTYVKTTNTFESNIAPLNIATVDTEKRELKEIPAEMLNVEF